MRTTIACMLLLTTAHRLSAQSLARFSFDSVAAIDLFQGENTVDRPNIVIDVTGVLRLSDGWVLYVRPWFRQPRTSEWDKEIYQAAIQYERSGTVSTRVDAGYIVSPIGLGMADTRPGVNPTIAASELRDADAGVRSHRAARAPNRLNLSARRTSHGLDGAVGRPRRGRRFHTDAGAAARPVGCERPARHERGTDHPGVRRLARRSSHSRANTGSATRSSPASCWATACNRTSARRPPTRGSSRASRR